MAQIIKQRRGSLEKLSQITGSLQKGEIVIATGSSNLSGVTNGQSIVFAAYESGSVSAVNRVFRGAGAPPVFSGSTYNGLMDGVPYYASASKTLYLLGSDSNEAIDLSGNAIALSGSIATSLSSSNYQISELSASVASVGGTFSSSVATDFSASAYNLAALSSSTYTAVFGFSGLSSSLANAVTQSTSASAYDLGNLSSSVATSFSASAAARVALSASIDTSIKNIEFLDTTFATTGSNTFKGNQIVSGTFELANSASTFKIEGNQFSQTYLTANGAIVLNPGYGGVEMVGSNRSFKATNITAEGTLSASVITGIGNVTDYSSSVNSRFSASAYNVAELSASTFTNSGSVAGRLNVIETTFATTGSNTFSGSQVVSGSLWVTGDVTIYGSSSLVNVTASAVTIGTNTIVLNTANPSVRFGGIKVIDSGSSQATGSLLWDSENNVWLYSNPVGAGYGSARLIAGPQNTGSLGEEIGLTFGYVPVAVGDDHIGDSVIKVFGNEVTIESGSLYVEGDVSASTINGIGNVTAFSSSISASFATINNNLGGGGSLGGRVANLETISASYLSFTQSYFTDSSSFDTRISSSVYNNSILSSSVSGTISQLSASVASDLNSASSSAFSTFAKLAGGNTFTQTQTFSNDVAVNGTANFNNAVAVNDANMNLGNSSALNLTGGSSIYVASTGTISGSITGIGNVSLYSASVDSRFSASAYNVAELSASVASVGGTFSSSVATDFSASNAARVALSASVATSFSASAANVINISSSVATSFSASAASQTNLSASIATSISASLATISFDSSSLETSIENLSSSVYNSLTASISSSTYGLTTLSTSVDSRLRSEEFKSTTFATTGSNNFTGTQTITGDVVITGSLYVQFGQDVSTNHISGNQGRIELGNTDDNIHIIAENELMLTATGSGVHVHSANFSVSPSGINNNVLVVSASQTTITNELSASNISGVGNIGQFSQSVDNRFDNLESSQSAFDNAMTVSGSGSGSTITILGNLKVQGTTTTIDSTTVSIGDNIISLNGTEGAFGGIQIADPTGASTVSGSLLWDSANDYWIAGKVGSEIRLADINYVSNSVATLSQSVATSFSSSNYEISSLSSSVASVTGNFSSSVATSFSASAASVTALSASIATTDSGSSYRLSNLEGSGSIQGLGTQNNVSFNSVTASINLGSAAGNSKRVAFRNTNGTLDLVPTASVAGDLLQWDGTDFIMSNTIDGGSF